ncbi:MAG: hypothetical protein GY707_00930 [Desulfobacteraceae bacterium]|nr:hypothetical protein [Desulfobacteraceae bacterium]
MNGNSVNEQGTIYITTGSAGASTDTVNKSEIKGEVVSLGISGVVDSFSKGENMGIPFLNLLLE